MLEDNVDDGDCDMIDVEACCKTIVTMDTVFELDECVLSTRYLPSLEWEWLGNGASYSYKPDSLSVTSLGCPCGIPVWSPCVGSDEVSTRRNEVSPRSYPCGHPSGRPRCHPYGCWSIRPSRCPSGCPSGCPHGCPHGHRLCFRPHGRVVCSTCSACGCFIGGNDICRYRSCTGT